MKAKVFLINSILSLSFLGLFFAPRFALSLDLEEINALLFPDDSTQSEKRQFENNAIEYQQNSDSTNDPCLVNLTAASGSIDMLQYLLDDAKKQGTLKKKINCVGNGTTTPLGQAVANNHVDAVKLLLKYGASVDNEGESSTPPLYSAIQNKNSEIIKLLLKYGADKTFPFDLYASEIIGTADDRSMLELLLDNASDKGVARKFFSSALIGRDFDLLSFLLNKGISANTLVEKKHPLLEITGSSRSNESDKLDARIAGLLLEHGADISKAEECDDCSLVFGAVQKNYFELTKLLLEHGADPEKPSRDYANPINTGDTRSSEYPVITPIDLAKKLKNQDILELLLLYKPVMPVTQ
jgi:ankyrin repeat protein